MKLTQQLSVVVLCLSAAVVAHATDSGQAIGFDVFSSNDADDSAVTKAALRWDYRYDDIEHYRGIKLEQARFSPLGLPARHDQRVYYRFADTGDRWKWNGALGSDGDTWLGNASIYNEDKFRQEYFVERERVETPQGLDRGLYYTFVGAAYDLPVDERNIFTVLGGVQDFSGDNRRLHLRGRYTHVLKEDWGLSLQLRGRYFHSSEPREYDYFSPRWYAEALPVLQLRRFHNRWQYQVAAGLGRQRDSDSDWRASRYLEASATSPKSGRDWFLKAGFVYSNTPGINGYGYDYRQFTLELTRRY